MSMYALTATLTLAAHLVAARAAAEPTGCAPGRYFLPGVTLVAGPDAPADDELNIMEIDGILVATLRSGGCPLGAARMQPRREFTKIAAKFGGCRDVPGWVVVKGRIIHPACESLVGRARVRKALARSERSRTFTGLKAPNFSAPDGMRVGSMGGAYTNATDGSSVDVPPGALIATQTAEMSVTEVTPEEVAEIESLLGLGLPPGLGALRALQVLMGRRDPVPRSSVGASLPDDGLPLDGTLLHVLTEPAFVYGVTDTRPPRLLYDGLVTQSGGRYELRLAPQSFGSPPGLSRVVHIPAGSPTCQIDGVVRESTGAPVAFALVEASSLPGLVTRAGPDGFYRGVVLAGPNTLAVTTDSGAGSTEFLCDPVSEPVVSAVDVEVDVPADAAVPVVAITDPAADETVAATVRTVSGTVGSSSVERVEIVTHTGTTADVFRQMAAVVNGSFSTKTILTPGRTNTLVVLATDPTTGRTGADNVVVTSTAASGEDLRFTMAWESNGTDVDMHVRVPGANGTPDTLDGDTIYFANSSAAGGVLDVDDTDGFGPENIVFPLGAAAPGTYAVAAHYWRGAPTASTVTVTVFLNGVPRGSFTRVLRQAETGTPLAPRDPGSVFNIATVTFPGGEFGPPADQSVFINGPE
jgi:uncharacterized protein YfaP (DUF2135 family)